MTRGLIVTKRPRSDPLPDRPVNFPSFKELHLELLEHKRKLRKGLPLIPMIVKKGVNVDNVSENFEPSQRVQGVQPSQVQAPTQVPPPRVQSSQLPVDVKVPSEDERSERGSSRKERRRLEREERRRKKKKSKRYHNTSEDDDDIVASLIGNPKPKKIVKEGYSDDGFDLEGSSDSDDGSGGSGGEEDVLSEDDLAGSDDESVIEKDVEVEKEKEDDPYAGLTPEEREEKEKEEYIWRFRILKKKYKNAEDQIPSFNEFSDLQTMKRTYDRTVRELYLDDAVESYRGYLMGGSIIIEFACTQWFDVDLGGFTIHQTKMMYKYDRLLIELGEKSYNQWGSTIPVEVRLLLMILFQAGLFYMAKIVTSRFGTTMADLFRSVSGMPPPAEEIKEAAKKEDGSGPPAKKMRGPSVKPADLRRATEVEDEQEDS